jgi:hypothetical protein
VRSQHDASVERIENSFVTALTEGRDVVPLADVKELSELASDAIILVGLIEEHERGTPPKRDAGCLRSHVEGGGVRP